MTQQREDDRGARNRCARALVCACLAVLAAALGACTDAPGRDPGPLGVLDLSGPWLFRTGDDLGWADPAYEAAGWQEVLVPVPWGRQGFEGYEGMAWYRLEVDLGVEREQATEARLGVQLGKVTSSYELYAGGVRLGGIGALPPAPRQDYDRHAIYALPPGAVSREGRVVLALRVWASGSKRPFEGGPFEGPFLLGPERELVRRQTLSELPQLVLSILFALIGLHHFYLYRRGYEGTAYLWFGLGALVVGGYTFLRTQWHYQLGGSFILWKEVEYLLLYGLPALFVQFLWSLLDRPVGRLLRLYQAACLALALTVALTPGLTLNLRTLNWWELSLLVMSAAALWELVRGLLRGQPEARTVAVGVVTLVATYALDIANDQGWITGPRLLHFGFAAAMFSMAASLAHRFGRLHGDAERLRGDLEVRVWERTAELSESNEMLQEEVRERERAEENLRRHLLAMEVSSDGMAILDTEFRYVYANAAFARMHGYGAAADLEGKPWNVVHERAEGDRLASEVLPLLREEGFWQGQALSFHRVRGAFPAEISAANLEGEGVVCVYRDVTERHKLDQIKDEFIATVSHELRTPLTSIKGALSLLAGGVVGELPDSAAQMVRIAHSNSDRLMRVINDLLDLQKIEAGKVDFDLRWQRLDSLLEQALAACRPMADERRVSLRLAEDRERAAEVRVDGDRFLQVLGNLLSNAIKFSPAGAEVSVGSRRLDGGISVAVADRGPGIPEEFRAHVFDRFAQARGTGGATAGGTGLGLSIARSLVRQQGGEIRFECGPEGGTTFFVELPILTASP